MFVFDKALGIYRGKTKASITYHTISNRSGVLNRNEKQFDVSSFNARETTGNVLL